MERYINPDIFIFFDNGEFCLWNYRDDKHYILDKEYVLHLLDVARDVNAADHPSDADFFEAGVFLSAPPHKAEWGWGKISHMFHVGTKNAVWKPDDPTASYVEAYLNDCQERYADIEDHGYRTTRTDGEFVALPSPELDAIASINLWEALKNRKTTRTFFDEPIFLQSLATILYCTFGEIQNPWERLESLGVQGVGTRKTSPAAGAVHSTDAYVIAMNVDGLAPGVYFYQCDKHHLIKLSDVQYRPIVSSLLAGQDFAASASALIVAVSRFDRLWKKYDHSRIYRACLLDIGHLSQTFHLLANSTGLNSWQTAAFSDDDFARILKLRPDIEDPMFVLALGRGNGDSLHPSMLESLIRRRAEELGV